MKNHLKKLLTGTRVLESRLTTAFEQAAQTVAGTNDAPPPLEIIDMAVVEIAREVQPAGRGRYSFPFNSITITFVAPTPEDQSRFEAVCAGPPSIDERVTRRLVSAGCSDADVDVTIDFAAAPAPDWKRPQFQIALARVKPESRMQPEPQTAIVLTVTAGTAECAEYSFTSFPVAIGRGPSVRDSRNQLLRINHVAFVEGGEEANQTVSRRHARIELDAATGRTRLVDDNSAQGTSVVRGGRGIAVPRGSRGLGLQSGDEIVIGQARLAVRIGLPAPAIARTTPQSRP